MRPRKSLEPWIRDEVVYYDHQIVGIRQLWKWRSFILADDMGLGKSLQALTVFAMDISKGWSKTCIVVCPVTLKENWADEVGKFSRIPYVVLNGTPIARNKQLLEFAEIEGPKILIVNYEQVVSHLETLQTFRFDVAVFDEAHNIKNPKSKRTKACHELYSRRSFLLTGTPMLNHVNDLWSLLHRVDPEGYPKYFAFTSRYCVFGGWKNKQIVGVKNERELTAKLHEVQLRRLKSEVLDLPEVQIIERRVDLSDAQRKIYDAAAQDLVIPNLDAAKDDDIENALTKFLRLKQVCGTTKSFTGEDVSSKLDLAIEDALELLENGNRIVVFTQFRDVLQCYIDRLTSSGYPIFQLHGDVPTLDRTRVAKEWAATSTAGVIVCMHQVAGVGLNLVAARHGQFLDKLFVPGLNKQSIDRMHRIGQDTTQPVQILEYICRNTIENRVNQINRTKKKLSDEIVEVDTLASALSDAEARKLEEAIQ